jgi:hypothetical protein
LFDSLTDIEFRKPFDPVMKVPDYQVMEKDPNGLWTITKMSLPIPMISKRIQIMQSFPIKDFPHKGQYTIFSRSVQHRGYPEEVVGEIRSTIYHSLMVLTNDPEGKGVNLFRHNSIDLGGSII